ncbi:hypothetical protein LOTGIDRAFT_126021 [Lottia gigantea]|uniref:Glycosyl hydrolase family 13 catalytic domain-containing protein n=1 Tax=Lottia gigantea TaxID=225164 RepID=V4A5E5_LOTGI|nr:hypothetical protein LOTGIDRAFT_126021 [Lottia gigantea]ESO88471.1 hypothetical protein LOTGIDRAFT_126021 [Lottia gigantea]
MKSLFLIYFLVIQICESAVGNPQLEWWQTTIIYQVYPRSFKDSDGDGTGDLRGIISKLDHFVYLGVQAIWLSPFYKSPNKDFGYDISNHTDVDPLFGDLEDFAVLINQAHKRDIKVIIDFVPNHTSDLHPWFQASIKKQEPYTDFYVWSESKPGPDGTRLPPNNWLSLFGGSAWKWNQDRQQFYYHAFLEEQPDLNYRNPKVIEEIKNVLRFWMNRGVDGVRCDAVLYLLESEDLSNNEPKSNAANFTSFQHESLDHIYTSHLPEIKQIITGWKTITKEYTQKDGKTRFMVIEAYETPEKRQAFVEYGADFAFNFDLITPIGITRDCGGVCIKDLVDTEYTVVSSDSWPNFQFGNHDRPRISVRRNPEAANAFNMLLLTLKGTPTTYYGEEIGMEEIHVSFEDTQDPFGLRFGKERYTEVSRDPCRSPLQWNDGYHSGFTTAKKPWLPVHPNYKTLNIQTQMESDHSPIQLYSQLARLRQEPSFQYGDLNYAVVNDNIFSYVRQTEGQPQYLVTINFGKSKSVDDYTSYIQGREGKVIAHTGNLNNKPFYKQNIIIDLSQIILKSDQGLVIEIISTKDEL